MRISATATTLTRSFFHTFAERTERPGADTDLLCAKTEVISRIKKGPWKNPRSFFYAMLSPGESELNKAPSRQCKAYPSRCLSSPVNAVARPCKASQRFCGSVQRIGGNALPAGAFFVGLLQSVPDALCLHGECGVGLAAFRHGHTIGPLPGVRFHLCAVLHDGRIMGTDFPQPPFSRFPVLPPYGDTARPPPC